jgi:hypothetical protein
MQPGYPSMHLSVRGLFASRGCSSFSRRRTRGKIAHTGLVNRLGVVTAARSVEHLAQQPGHDMDPRGKKASKNGVKQTPSLQLA